MRGVGDHSANDDVEAAIADGRAGNTAGLTTLFRVYHPRLIRYLRAHEPRAADDLAADTWLAVAGRLRSFEGDGVAFSAWIFSIARRRLADHRRTGARRRTSPVADTELLEASPIMGSDVGVIASMSAQAAVDLVIAALTADQADVVLLRTLAGLPTSQIGDMLGHTENWVRVTHHRAMQRLQQVVLGSDRTMCNADDHWNDLWT